MHGKKASRALVACMLLAAAVHTRAESPGGGNIHVNAFDLPLYSGLLKGESRQALARWSALVASARARCDPLTKTSGPEIRSCEALYYPPLLEEARKQFPVDIREERIGNVRTDVLTPADGVSRRNAQRVLIYAHSGGFQFGARYAGQIEAMPVAALGQYRVVAVDYRMAPEHRFPDATVDITAVYEALLKHYSPSQIGLYGCSAGGRLVGQTLAWIASKKLPRPGAAGTLCSPPAGFGGDSNIIVAALNGAAPQVRSFAEGYFRGVDPADPIAFPGEHDEHLRNFPPTLLITSTRDNSLSPMVTMHNRMVALGIDARLHVFEGLRHAAYMLNMYLPETRQAARLIANFFDARLAPPLPP